jgi:hypothetical protein
MGQNALRLPSKEGRSRMKTEDIITTLARLMRQIKQEHFKNHPSDPGGLDLDTVEEAAIALRFLLQERETQNATHAEAIEIIRGFHGRVKIDGTSLRLGAPSPNSIMGRAAAILAVSPPQSQGDSTVEVNNER